MRIFIMNCIAGRPTRILLSSVAATAAASVAATVAATAGASVAATKADCVICG